ncbi:conserved hypothetical protein [Desulforamulus hydrothermalis Lam5 = DSM 18033]|uniref:Uncharacterized protein n=1 Tax=Desulforamulus hydrothermalis Lam5 = DSM 18033 TaxID=1121428 RepID=K8E106_9FIRM|nr:conserved hypothetical protein [Desulforamulus hydrothermalis Lam5 = DSM 18033]
MLIALLSMAILLLALWVVPNISLDTTAIMEVILRKGLL